MVDQISDPGSVGALRGLASIGGADVDQLNLMGEPIASADVEEFLLDPAKYQKDRAECRFPDTTPSSAYRYGCRCVGCYKFHSAEAQHRKRNGGFVVQPCKVMGCDKPRRRVQGARYCDDHALSIGYQMTGRETHKRQPRTCVVCNQTSLMHVNKKLPMCSPCQSASTRLIQQARKHKASQAHIEEWISNPTCNLCSKRFYLGRGSGATGFVIDHDHNCCHGGASCGKCIRGILCSACNLSLGHVESMAGKAGGVRNLFTYIESARVLAT